MSSAAELIPVREAHRFDEARLADYLRELLRGCRGDSAIRQFQGGQSNPTFLVEAGGRRWVLRKKPPGKLLPSAHMVEREYRIIRALADTGVPVPPARLLCEDAQIIGTPFYVMDFVAGRVFTDPRLPDLAPGERGAVYTAMAETLARLHSVDWRAGGASPDLPRGRPMPRPYPPHPGRDPAAAWASSLRSCLSGSPRSVRGSLPGGPRATPRRPAPSSSAAPRRAWPRSAGGWRSRGRRGAFVIASEAKRSRVWPAGLLRRCAPRNDGAQPSGLGTGSPASRQSSTYSSIASRILARASARVSPWLTHPGSAGTVATYPPSAARCRTNL